MSAYAIFRLPHETHATIVRQTQGEPMELLTCQELNGRRGFVVAPFEIRQDQPILLIRPDEVETFDTRDQERCVHVGGGLQPVANSQHNRSSYAIDFANYHAQLLRGTFRKIVLARCADESTAEPIEPMQLFLLACERYPRMFISLVSTQKSGCWLTATPEILLEGDGRRWRTIALAGTMKLEGEQLAFDTQPSQKMDDRVSIRWTTKNIQEQRIVATYITECLEQFTSDFREEGPLTVRAANLVHLRSDFTFTLPDSEHIGDLLHALHPTPAVCGLPKHAAYQFIVRNEHTPRRYYSGFMGPLDICPPPTAQPISPPYTGGACGGHTSTHLYVSLRCMKIEGLRYHLYAGGGLLGESTEEQEWQETEAKLETMRSLLGNSGE